MTKESTKVLIASKFDPILLEWLRTQGVEHDVREGIPRSELLERIPAYEVLLMRTNVEANAQLLGGATNLKLVVRGGVGVDNIDLDYAASKGISVTNTPGGNAVAVAELTMSAMSQLVTPYLDIHNEIVGRRWPEKQFKRRELAGKILGVVGFGHIGREVSRLALNNRMNVICYDPYVLGSFAERLGGLVVDGLRNYLGGLQQLGLVDVRAELPHFSYTTDLDDLLRGSDIITFHAPQTRETVGMVGSREFGVMKEGVYVVNAARGGLLDYKALREAVKGGHVRGAFLDVFPDEVPDENDPIRRTKHILLSAHMGGTSDQAQPTIAKQVIGILEEYLARGKISSALNLLVDTDENTRGYLPLVFKVGDEMAAQLVSGEKVQALTVDYGADAQNLHKESLEAALLVKVFPGMCFADFQTKKQALMENLGTKIEFQHSQGDYILKGRLITDKQSCSFVIYSNKTAEVTKNGK